MSKEKIDDLAKTVELFDFLQGKLPEGFKISRSHMPKLTPDQAWTVIWYLGNQYWQVPDHIERCCICGDLYNSEAEGECLDYGKSPYHFCESCRHGDAYVKKMRRNPDKEQKKQYFTL